MRPLADLKFIAARVREHVRTHRSRLPLLGAPEPVELVWRECRVPGHSGLVPKRAGRQRCLACDREQKRAKAKGGAS